MITYFKKYWVVTILLISIILNLFIMNLNKINSDKAKQWEQNYNSLSLNSANQIEFNKSQLKQYEFKIDSLAKVLGIKTKDIRNVIVTKYSVKYDTIIQKELIYDSINKMTNFSFTEPKNCYLIEGTAIGNVSEINLNKIENNDIITTYLYDSRGYFFFELFPKFWKDRLITAKVYSECKGDTISVTKNILIK